jgi:hypothetical protein
MIIRVQGEGFLGRRIRAGALALVPLHEIAPPRMTGAWAR